MSLETSELERTDLEKIILQESDDDDCDCDDEDEEDDE